VSRSRAPLTRSWVLHPDIRNSRERPAPGPALEEAVALARALGGLSIEGAEVVPVARVRPGYLFGAGSTEALKRRLKEAAIELVLVDGALTPVQQRNLEDAWGVKLLDRTGLILEIFAERARTREGVLQVELAALSYQRTRLVRAWTHLERQRGGLGFVGGPGETQIEADRRAIDEAINRIRRQLAKVTRTRALHRAARARVPFPVVALVGYTNAGKSTLFNRLTGAGVTARDMLFATLDPTMRALALPSGQKAILSDTVGFISNLPTQLVAAFRATLEEVVTADVIVHLRDISHPDSARQAHQVEHILDEMGVAQDTPRLELLNKLDLLDAEERAALARRAARQPGVLAISARDGTGIAAFLEALGQALAPAREQAEIRLGHGEGRKRAWAFSQGIVEDERHTEDGPVLQVRWSALQKKRFHEL